jgi:hypothetical protein
VKSSPPDTGSDSEVIAMLARYQCPTPFHVVRTRLMGKIASPVLDGSPMEAMAQLWGGQLPQFASIEDAQAAIGVLLTGLWNRLAERQSSRSPFHLLRRNVEPSRTALHSFALMRQQELEGFVEGLFGSSQELFLPEKAHHALGVLATPHAIFAGAADLLADPTKPAPDPELKALVHNLQQVSVIAEAEINKVIQSCKRARGQHLEAMAAAPTSKTVFH